MMLPAKLLDCSRHGVKAQVCSLRPRHAWYSTIATTADISTSTASAAKPLDLLDSHDSIRPNNNFHNTHGNDGRHGDRHASRNRPADNSPTRTTTTTAASSRPPRTTFRRDLRVPESPFIYASIHGLSCTMSDIQHALRQGSYPHPFPVNHVLHRIRRHGTTSISMAFTSVEHANHARRVLNQTSLNGVMIRCYASARDSLPPRFDALHVSAESGPGKVVSLHGLPSAMKSSQVRETLRGYELVENVDLQVQLLRTLEGKRQSIWLVRCKSADEAQRMVRNLHRTDYLPEKMGRLHPISAEIFY